MLPNKGFAGLAAVLACAFVVSAAEPADDAKAVAVKVATAGAALFDARDAKGLAATYTDDARLEVFSREKDTGTLKVETRAGRADVESYYEEFFKNGGTVHARSTVEHARWVEPDLLEFSGLFEPNTESSPPLKLPFTQLRTRQGDAWKVVRLQLFIFPQKTP